NSVAAHTMQTEVDLFLVEGPPGIGANPEAILGYIIGKNRVGARRGAAAAKCSGRQIGAGKHPIAESAVYPEHFVVPEARLKRKLGNNIWGRVKGIAGCRGAGGGAGSAYGAGRAGRGGDAGGAIGDSAIVEATPGAGRTHQEVVGVAVTRNC